MENTAERKKIVLSAIQPTGTPTLGNYLGALKNWKNMSKDYDCLYAVADLHSLTVRPEPQALCRQTLEMYAILLALGLDPEENIVFIQLYFQKSSNSFRRARYLHNIILSWIFDWY